MNLHLQLDRVDAYESLVAADGDCSHGEVAPISRDCLRIGVALKRAIPPSGPVVDTAPVRSFRWAQGGQPAADLFFVPGTQTFSARQNVAAVLSKRTALSDRDRELARGALSRLEEGRGEDIEQWAARLGADFASAGE